MGVKRYYDYGTWTEVRCGKLNSETNLTVQKGKVWFFTGAMASNQEPPSTSGVLKTASVISRVLFEIVQVKNWKSSFNHCVLDKIVIRNSNIIKCTNLFKQAKQTHEQVGIIEEAILPLEAALQKVDEKDEQKLGVLFIKFSQLDYFICYCFGARENTRNFSTIR